MEHYVTLFDSLFLPQGLALHMSMERHVKAYTLWILCMDDEVHSVLAMLDLPNVRLLQLSRLETENLKQIKPTRTNGEYCWTLTPFAPRFVFETDPAVTRVTYLDADLWFLKNPAPIFREFDASGKDVLITEHAYAPENDQTAVSGQYCVQFVTFKRHGGETVRRWWEERCIEWCYARLEDGKFGDQKYLDDWPERFNQSVHVLKDKELALAPWNATRYPYGNGIFWHFHALRIENSYGKSLSVFFGPYTIPRVTLRDVYASYVAELRRVIQILSQKGVTIRLQQKRTYFEKLRAKAGVIYRQIRKLFPETGVPL